MSAQLFLGGAADVMRERIADASIDMIYCDPPFGNGQTWTGAAGSFSDKWTWDYQAERRWKLFSEHSRAAAELLALVVPNRADRAYIAMIAELLIECRRALRLTGTLWLHFDDTMGAELRILGDVLFGLEHQLGTIIWHRSTGRATKRGFARVHDTIAVWGRTRVARARLSRIGNRDLVRFDEDNRLFVDGFLDDRLSATSAERVGYPTQKPVSLIERFIRAGTLRGGTVLDPTCGSGTALVAARNLGRAAIGIDLSPDAISTARGRLEGPARRQGELFEAAA